MYNNGKDPYVRTYDDAEANTWEPERHLEDYGGRTLLQEFNTACDKKHVHSHLCRARNDDPVGRTTYVHGSWRKLNTPWTHTINYMQGPTPHRVERGSVGRG